MNLRDWVEAVAPYLAIPPHLVDKVPDGDTARSAVLLEIGSRFWYVFDGEPGAPLTIRLKSERCMVVDEILFAMAENPLGLTKAFVVRHPIWGDSTIYPAIDTFGPVQCFEYQPGLADQIELLAGQQLELGAEANSAHLPRGIIAGSYNDGQSRRW